jgi:hypothetical protein
MMKKLNKLIKNFLPYGVVISKQRKKAVMPKIPTSDIHVDGGRLISNRLAMLELLPKDGVVAELGVDTGDFTEKILNINNPKKLELVDIWGSARYNEAKFDSVCEKFSQYIKDNKVSITRKLSTEAAESFDDNYFDWIYIDTNHSYQTTKEELHAYKHKVKDTGFIAGHDYVMGNWNKPLKYGVMEAVAEFCVQENWKIVYLTADISENNSFVITRISN